jgi:transcriptional regulator with XRE-family HTH domain
MIDYPLGFGERIRKLRLRHGITVKALAKAGGWSEMTIWRLESNKTEPTFRQAISLSLLLGVDLDCMCDAVPLEHPELADLLSQKDSKESNIKEL